MTTVFIISAPSGSGKSTLVRRLMQHVPGPAFFGLLHHPGAAGQETDGEDYNFISRAEFDRGSTGEFLE